MVRGNNLETVRQLNLSMILRMVHHSGSIQRSVLTSRTGLNRSTIADLVGELVALGLVDEATAEKTKSVGRPSTVVRPNGDTVAIAVSAEMDAVTIGVVGLGGVVHDRIRYNTDEPPSAGEVVKISAAIIQGIQSTRTRIVGIGVAVPGLVRGGGRVVHNAPGLKWTNECIADDLEGATNLPVIADNDASLGVMAERLFGAGRGLDDILYLNGGTSGIGGGIISNGVALRGSAGYAGEFGHIRMNDGPGVVDNAGFSGTLEANVTRSALTEALGVGAVDADELEQALVTSTSPVVRAVVDRQIDFLGATLGSAVSILNPELIVLGGFLGSLYVVNPQRLEFAAARAALPASWACVRITRARLGSKLLLVGAAELAFAAILSDPAGSEFIKPVELSGS
ncbi:ROK family protein [Nakamurella sp. PAMC28650]|nr:ROK family protein [Nakamurella sp. PAMC28650]